MAQVGSGGAKDSRGQLSSASNSLAVTYDGTAPVCSLTGPRSKQSSPFQVSFDWSEPVAAFQRAHIVLGTLLVPIPLCFGCW